MTDSAFRRRLRAAIEARESLATFKSPTLDLDEDDLREWRRQRQLDEAILAWKRASAADSKRIARHPRRSAGILLTAALGLGIVGLFLVRAFNDQPVGGQIATDFSPAPTATADAPQPVESTKSASRLVENVVPHGELMAVGESSTRDDDFRETADRLAYAVAPVGQGVTNVMQRLIDAVPGAEVLAASWVHDT